VHVEKSTQKNKENWQLIIIIINSDLQAYSTPIYIFICMPIPTTTTTTTTTTKTQLLRL
jgi:hypothetical protein